MPLLSNLISFDTSGINILSFPEIREALIEKYQDVYGSDIDLSTGSADGVFISELSLILNNIAQTCLKAYSQLDVNVAYGRYLDSLCALSNVYRKPATRSVANITVTNIGVSSITLDNPRFVDKSGTTWKYNGSITLGTTSPSNSQSILVECETLGPIQAPATWIYQTVDYQSISVVQTNAATVGKDAETDEALRARRAQSSGASGTTTIESLIGALLQINDIYDVKVYNNNSDSSETITGDNTTVDEHSIYIAIHKNPNVTIEDETIGSIIHQKLTPGVKTTPKGGSSYGTAKTWQFIDNVYGRQVVESEENIYWKECNGIHLPITITIDNLFHFNANTCDKIGENVIKYVNNLHIGDNLYDARIFAEITNAVNASDPGYRSSPTFTINNINVSSSINPWAYYDYTTITPVATHEDSDPDKPIISYTITIT